MIKLAVVQCADTGPLESLALMLRSVGIETAVPSAALQDELKRLGCDTVLSIDHLAKNWGYQRPNLGGREFAEAGPADMRRSDVLFVDVKAHRNGPKVWVAYPNLRERTLWYRINGGKPEVVPGCGDELNPPCPVLTPNQWYAGSDYAYVCWPPFYRIDEFLPRSTEYTLPVCLVHNLHGWGYGKLVAPMAALGVKMYGVRSPHGLVQRKNVPAMFSSALAYVHLKSNDAPGYALYEAMAAKCPVVCTRRLIWRCRMQELLKPAVTCLTFDRETHDGLSDDDVTSCILEVKQHLEVLHDPAQNKRFGEAGREQLQRVQWSEDRDAGSLREFLGRSFK